MFYRARMFGKVFAVALAGPAAAVAFSALAVVVGVVGVHPGVAAGAGGAGSAGGSEGGGAVASPGRVSGDAIPPEMLRLYQAAAPTCPGLPWELLAGIGRVETDHGRNTAVSSAGAEGPMQFMPATWQEYGVDVHGTGMPDINDPADSVFSAARLLCADGAAAPGGLSGAIFAYNHSDQYVADVLGWAATYSTEYGTAPG